MVGLLSQMEGSDHMVTPADHTGTPSDHSMVTGEHSTVGQNDNAVESGEGLIVKPSVEMCTETEAQKDDSGNQDVTSDDPSNLDSTKQDQVDAKKMKSILKQRGQYTMRKVKVDFDLIPKRIPFDETKDYTVEIKIVAKEPVKIKSWAAIFAAQKAEAEAEAAATAEADAALKKAEGVMRREALKKASKVKQVKKEGDNKRVTEEQHFMNEKTEESSVDQRLAQNYDGQQLEEGIPSHPITEAHESEHATEVLSVLKTQLNPNTERGKELLERSANVGGESNVEDSVVQFDNAAEVSLSEDGKSSDVSESLIENVESYDISESLSVNVSENLRGLIKKDGDSNSLSKNFKRADFPESISGEVKDVEGCMSVNVSENLKEERNKYGDSGILNAASGSLEEEMKKDGDFGNLSAVSANVKEEMKKERDFDSSSEDVRSTDASESLSVDAKSVDVSQELSADATSTNTSERLSSGDEINSEYSGSTSRNGKNSDVSVSLRDLNSVTGEQSYPDTMGGNSIDSKGSARISMDDNQIDGIVSTEFSLHDEEKLPEEILITAVSLVAEVLAETPVKLKAISFDVDSETDCTSINTDFPDPEKIELQNDDSTESSYNDFPNEDKTKSILDELSEISSLNSKTGGLEQSDESSSKNIEELPLVSAENVKFEAETSKIVLTDEHKVKVNNLLVSQKLNESLKRASTEIIQTAVRVLVEVEKVTLAVVNNLEPIVP